MPDEPAPQLRASDAERERAVERLRDGAPEGRLSLEELADRTGLAAGARTRAELDRLTADLPASPGPSAAGGAVAAPTQASSVFGDVRREGAWVVPPRGRWSTVFGDVVLDLREARVGAAEVEVQASTVFGDVELLVPEGVLVEVRTRTVFGDTRQEAGGVAAAGAPRVILSGGTLFGDVRVRSRRLRERLLSLRGPG